MPIFMSSIEQRRLDDDVSNGASFLLSFVCRTGSRCELHHCLIVLRILLVATEASTTAGPIVGPLSVLQTSIRNHNTVPVYLS